MSMDVHNEEKLKVEPNCYAGEIEGVDQSYGELTPEEDKRILRKLDMWYKFFYCETSLL